MPKPAWIVAAALTCLFGLAFLGFTTWQRGLELQQTRVELDQARATQQTNQTRITELDQGLAQAQTQLDDLRRQNQQATEAQKSLEAEMRRALESKEVTISELQGKLTVNILDRILFDSGEAQLKPEGHEVLKKVAAVLAQYPLRQIHVIGHTDNVPIGPTFRAKYPTNWELSTARATAAVRFLVEQAGVDPLRLGAVGYGEFRPVADNASSEGRARNRRIAIVILSDRLVGVDATPEAEPVPNPPPAAASTNPPPAAVTPPAALPGQTPAVGPASGAAGTATNK
jgi:chemotaxis protein MotB